MKANEFNESTKVPRYSYQPSPVHDRAFLIVKTEDIAQEAIPVGDYTVLDQSEPQSLSEKKVMNVVSALNGKKDLIQLGEETKSRQLFHLISDGTDGDKVKVMFYKYTGEGASEENAFFQLEGTENVWN